MFTDSGLRKEYMTIKGNTAGNRRNQHNGQKHNTCHNPEENVKQSFTGLTIEAVIVQGCTVSGERFMNAII